MQADQRRQHGHGYKPQTKSGQSLRKAGNKYHQVYSQQIVTQINTLNKKSEEGIRLLPINTRSLFQQLTRIG